MSSARSPPAEANAQQLIALEAVEAIPELEFDQTANLTAEAGNYRLVADAGAEPVPELEFDQTLDGNPALQSWYTRRSVRRRGPVTCEAH